MPHPFKTILSFIRRLLQLQRLFPIVPPAGDAMQNTCSTEPTDSPSPARPISSLPPYPVVCAWFIANGYPVPEAQRFYQRYQLFGWNSRVVPTLPHWPQLADHWMRTALQMPGKQKSNSSGNGRDTGTDNSPTGPV